MKNHKFKQMLRGKFLSKYKVAKWFWLKEERKGNPVTLEVHPTYKCSFSCSFCIDKVLKDVSDGKHFQINRDSKSMLSKENMDAILNGVDELNIQGVVLSGGGEPTENPNTPYLVEELAKQNVSVGMFTHGAALNDRTIPIYVDNLAFIRFSFDDFDAENYAKTKGVKPELYDRVMNNIKKCVTRRDENAHFNETEFDAFSRCKIGFSFIITNDNIDRVVASYEECLSIGVDYVQFCDCVVQGYKFTDRVKKLIRHALKECYELKAMKEGAGKTAPVIVYEPLQAMNETPCNQCRAKDYIFLVGGDGGVRPGPHTARHDELLYGNINENSLEFIWQQRPAVLDTKFVYEYCRFREQNNILRALENIEHERIL